MSLRDQALAATAAEAKDGFKVEKVSIPEWDDATVLVRELNIGDHSAYMASGRKFVQDDAGKVTVLPNDDPLDGIKLVVLSAYEEDGVTRVFTDADVEPLSRGGKKTRAALDRIFEVAWRLGEFGTPADEAVDEAGKDSSTTKPSSSSSS